MASFEHKGMFKRLSYRVLQVFARIAAVMIFDLRCYGRQHLRAGAALVLSTHQSNFDTVLVGVAFNDRLNYLARRTLFKNAAFAAFIKLLDAIELDRDRSGLAGLKETLKRLKAQQKVLVFPEGTRTLDGRIGELKPGFLAVARRSHVPLIPLAITGAFETLPRGSIWPKRNPLKVSIGQVIEYSEYQHLSDQQAIDLITNRLQLCYQIAECQRRRG